MTEGYGVDFGLDQYALMAQLMRSMKGKSIVSVNDHPAMREAFADLSMKTLQIKYTVGGGAKAKKAGELLIWNW
jgi:DNA adenine methylase